MPPKPVKEYFPKEPYPLQLEIAQCIYKALDENKKLAIIQSPTGTGKTYSLLCPIVAWLSNNQHQLPTAQIRTGSKLPSWLSKPSEQKGQMLLQSRSKAKEKMIELKQAARINKNKKRLHAEQNKHAGQKKEQSKDDEIEVEYQDDGGQLGNGKKHFSLHKKLIEKEMYMDEKNILPKLIFVSRTHSQLSQVIDSLKQIPHELNYLELASKQQLCINKDINEDKNSINQKCQHLLDHGKCSYFHQLQIKQFLNKNIEQIAELGKNNDLCPYFSTRTLLQQAQILCLPYSSILSQDIRGKLGINIHNSIVVFDEGHNILDHEKQMHSPEVKMEELQLLASQVDEYLTKYRTKLKIRNEKLLQHLLEVLRTFSAIFSQQLVQAKQKGYKSYIKINFYKLLASFKDIILKIQIQKIIKYFELNNIDKKISYFNAHGPSQLKNKQYVPRITPALVNRILFFIRQFVNFSQQFQVLILKWNEYPKGTIKIMTLKSRQLQSIIDRTRMTIIAGGTMEPLDELMTLTEKWKSNMIVNKYPHIIKDDQCKIYLVKSCQKKQIYFNHQTLNRPDTLAYFKPICTQLLNKVMQRTQKGGGIVIFIQNYQLLSFYQQIFKGQPYDSRILYDNRNKQQKDTEGVFLKYKKLVEADTVNQHILISVMGGKLSEGINFADRLARSLIVFGLPYSNIYAPQIVETMNNLDCQKNPSFTGKHYYEGMCIKTLNQTIGRGVRHLHDYVNIYLVDSRFQQIQEKLSSWMRPRIIRIQDITYL